MMRLFCSQGHENPEDNRFCRLCGEKLAPALPDPFQSGILGQTLGLRYRVVRELGHGGFGRTYLAEDTNRFHEFCVLKEFAPQVQGTQALQKAEELFEREAGILYKLQHPQIPRFRELFRATVQGRGRLFLVQDYVEGQTYQAILRDRHRQGTFFTEPEVTRLLLQLLPVLAYIHHCGVVHRDISPDNLILRSADGLPVLIDFGGVKQVAVEVAFQLKPAPMPVEMTRLGKAGYAPSEQMRSGAVSPNSDLYALAATGLALLTGKEPQELLENNQYQWHQLVNLTPTLMEVLNRMLDPHPTRRYQSAEEVIQALNGALPAAKPAFDPAFNPAFNPGMTQPPVEEALLQEHPTFAVSPVAAGVTYSSTLHSSTSQPAPRRSGVGIILLVLLMAGTGGLSWWVSNSWLSSRQPEPKPTQSINPGDNTSSDNNSSSTPQFSQAEQSRKQAIDQRRQELGIDSPFLVSLVNQAFYAKHSELTGRQLSKGPEDEALRTEWDELAVQFLDRLQSLSSNARSRLGRYTEADISQRQSAVNQLNLSSRALNDLTDSKFFSLFPDQPRDQNLLKQPIGQVWQAIAADQVSALQSGATLERIKFAEGRFSQQVNGTLKPGAGKAYIVSLSKDQTIRLTLQAPDRALRLSLYPPTSKSPALLDDSSENRWTGKLTETGFYEIVVASDTSQSIDYTINLAAADDVTSPDPP